MFDGDFRRHVPPHLRAAMDRLLDPQAVWDIFRDPQTIGDMERLTAVKRPAVGAASAKLLALGDWVREDDAKRTFGKIARCIMEANGYVIADKGVETPEDSLFRKGARYRLRTPVRRDPEGTTLVLRDMDSELASRLHDRARRSGRSLEGEALLLLTDALLSDNGNTEPNLAEAIHRRFAALGGVDNLLPHPAVPTDTPPMIEP
jgi:antitoxin FitA